MTIEEAIKLGIMHKSTETGRLTYSGKCKECKHSRCYSYPASSNMCMNKKSEWHGTYHVDPHFGRYVDGCKYLENYGYDDNRYAYFNYID